MIWLDRSHINLESMEKRRLLDGDEKDLRYSYKAQENKEYLPYDHFTQAILA